jgi:hypothetical protein
MMRRGSGELMSTAGNADDPGQGGRNGAYIEVALTLSAWLILTSVFLLSKLTSIYGAPRGIYDALALSAFLVYVGALIARSVLRTRPDIPVLASSALLTITYYTRLLNILSADQGKLTLLPLVNILDFRNIGSSVLVLDLGQIGLYTFLYVTLTVVKHKYTTKTRII